MFPQAWEASLKTSEADDGDLYLKEKQKRRFIIQLNEGKVNSGEGVQEQKLPDDDEYI